ncbi:MAG: class I SAM-dependent methyltransferase [Oxalobacteraceae bacterium]|jgi:ubiquinone/menaquinone biosynthesis C-methylase UbiE|nr:class I SAM-dependent methyltransferase [Oxalobacteraceae bacterium]
MTTKSLDLGCGAAPKNIFGADQVYGVDVRTDLENNVYKADLAIEDLPFAADFFDFVTAHDFIEHIPRVVYAPKRRNSFVELMNEIWRVLKIGGRFLSVTPAYPQPAAFVDPTHVNIITEQTFPLYFDDQNRWAKGYGFVGAFKIVSQEWKGAHLLTVLEKTSVKDAQHNSDHTTQASNIVEVKKDQPVEAGNSSATTNKEHDGKSTDDLHVAHWEHFFSDELHAKLYPTWWDATTANHWRHRRFLEGAIDILGPSNDSWLTVGDGSGHDTWILRNEGFTDILTTDIGDGTLKQSYEEGHITKYQKANAESLEFQDNQFDFVLCKEALHHMRRPYQAIYEMIRVAKKAVVIIEPQDLYIDTPTMSGPARHTWERVGNYVFGFSKREFQKIALGLNLPGVALKNICDAYIQGCEFHPSDESDPVFSEMKRMVESGEDQCQKGQAKWNYILTIIIKSEELSNNEQILSKIAKAGWDFERTDLNPYI